jgi:hypothetical protein
VYLLTPNGRWNPNDDAYAFNEASMLDWEGNLMDKKDRVEVLLSQVPEDQEMSAAAVISDVEARAIDKNLKEGPSLVSDNGYDWVPNEVSPIYDPDHLCYALQAKAEESHFKASIGSTSMMIWNSKNKTMARVRVGALRSKAC